MAWVASSRAGLTQKGGSNTTVTLPHTITQLRFFNTSSTNATPSISFCIQAPTSSATSQLMPSPCFALNTADLQIFVIKPCLDLTRIWYISPRSCCSHLLVLCSRSVFQLCDVLLLCMVWTHVKQTDLVSPLTWLRPPWIFSNNQISNQYLSLPCTVW